jgi:type II restriction enzyme
MNIGEATETYAWLRLVLDGKITGAKADLSAWPAKTWQIQGVSRVSSGVLMELAIQGNTARFSIGGKIVDTVPKKKLEAISDWLRERLAEGSWDLKDTQRITHDIQKLFAQAILGGSKGKADLIPTVEEPIQAFTRIAKRGLSVKSTAGAPPSLVNASKQTRFRFRVGSKRRSKSDSTPSQLVNSLGHSNLEFEGLRSDSYEHNLAIVDSHLAEMLAWMLIEYFATRTVTVSELCDRLTAANPLNLRSVANYRRKIGEFLVASALGMVPATRWTGAYEADGGMLVVKQSGDLVTFFVVDAELKEELSLYLLNSCYLDTPSTERHQFGSIYSEDGVDFLDLALQIRLKMPKG